MLNNEDSTGSAQKNPNNPGSRSSFMGFNSKNPNNRRLKTDQSHYTHENTSINNGVYHTFQRLSVLNTHTYIQAYFRRMWEE